VPLRAVQGDVSDLAAATEGAQADLVLCHSVLEYVDDPDAAMIAIAGLLRPGGVVSVLAASSIAAVIHRVLAGRFDEARRLIAALEPERAAAGSLPRRFTLSGVTELIVAAGLRPGHGHGVRVFTDLVPSMLVNTDPSAVGALLALERTASVHPEFRGLATQLHVLGFR
jgi:S-adenosylmethionine-dependent methyltransferase